jgi:acyl-CoA synthetase (AMP-forming)/AMP-acid ligase II
VDWSTLNVFGDVPRLLASRLPDKPALVSASGAATFAAVNARMNRFANTLTGLGLRPGDRVAVLARNRIEVIEAYGAGKAGFAILPLNWRLSAAELLHPLTDGAPAALLAEPGFVPMLDGLRAKIPSLRHLIQLGPAQQDWLAYEALLAAASPAEPEASVHPGDLLCLMYTSGTTGRPKGAMLTHAGLLANCRAAVEWMLGLEEHDVALAAMPLFHVGGLWYHLFPAYAAGCTTVLLPEFAPAEVLTAIEKHGVTYAHFVPTMINALIHHPAVGATDLSRLRVVYYAASSMPVDLLRKAMATFPHCDFMQGYGSTEGGMITALTAEDHRAALTSPAAAARLATCGQPLHCELRILDPDKDGIGEVAVRSNRTMSGYWRDPAATAAVMRDGWFRTGDLGTLDADLYLTIAERKNDMIVSGGENVYPREVENALYQDPAVLEVAVFGLPDPHWVERVVAAVVLKPGAAATADELRQRARTRLAGYKCPKTIFLCDSLPKSGAGKILKKELRRMYAEK